MADLELEKRLIESGYKAVVGFDEVGRGSWAGPLVVGAVILPVAGKDAAAMSEYEKALLGLNDSKRVSEKFRSTFYDKVSAEVSSGVHKHVLTYSTGWVWPEEIAQFGITLSVDLAVGRALSRLSISPDYVLADAGCVSGRFSELGLPVAEIEKGDAVSKTIAAASVLAKVERDRYMVRLDAEYPVYGFAKHKGYGTAQHSRALAQYGAAPVHRKNFEPIKKILALQGG